jgi:hypothetical protein
MLLNGKGSFEGNNINQEMFDNMQRQYKKFLELDGGHPEHVFM